MAQTTTTSTGVPQAGTPPNPLISFTPIIVVCGILYMLVIRPQQKQAKDHRRLVESLKPGDRVLTQGGIYGTVVNLKGPSLTVKIADNVKVEVNRSAISQVVVESSNGSTTPSQGQSVA
jgi:preprotein translocase subunit YajC